jgi:hypothetical protein
VIEEIKISRFVNVPVKVFDGYIPIPGASVVTAEIENGV